MRSSDGINSRPAASRSAWVTPFAAWLALAALTATASAQVAPRAERTPDRGAAESKPPHAQYDIGAIVRRLAADEAQGFSGGLVLKGEKHDGRSFACFYGTKDASKRTVVRSAPDGYVCRVVTPGARDVACAPKAKALFKIK